MTNIYKITHKSYRGAAYAMYKKGELCEFLLMFDPVLSSFDAKALSNHFPFKATDLPDLAVARFQYVELVPRTAADKIAMFCMTFRAFRNSAYTAKKEERANIADVTVSDKLLTAYFTNDTFPLTYAKSINDYIRHYNYIRDIATNGTPVKSAFPDVYDREFERGLEGEKLSAYWVHLNKLGWKKSDGAWIKTTLTQQ